MFHLWISWESLGPPCPDLLIPYVWHNHFSFGQILWFSHPQTRVLVCEFHQFIPLWQIINLALFWCPCSLWLLILCPALQLPSRQYITYKGFKELLTPLLCYSFARTGGHAHCNFLIWLQGQVVEKCILIIPSGNNFSHVSFILPFVKSSKEGLGIWVANMMSLCNLHVTCDDSQAFSSIPSAAPLHSNWLVRSLSLPCSFHHSCGHFKSGISFGMCGVTALGFESYSLPINLNLIPQVQLDFQKK